MNRSGFTLIEVVVALVLLAFGMLALQSGVLRLVHEVGSDTRSTEALQLVLDRAALVRSDPRYELLESRYSATETDPTGAAGLVRVTDIQRTRDSTANGITDYKRITITVSGSGLSLPVSRTFSVGAP